MKTMGLPLEVGIEQADFAGGAGLPAAFASFSLIVSNQVAGDAPTPDTALLATANTTYVTTLVPAWIICKTVWWGPFGMASISAVANLTTLLAATLPWCNAMPIFPPPAR
jgi:hypothetical protein